MSYEINILTRIVESRRVESAPLSLLEFKNPRDAVLFAIHLDHSYFPLNEKDILRIRYGDYVQGFNSLALISDILKNRRYISIQDFSACWNGLSDAEKYLGVGLNRAAKKITQDLKSHGIKPEELIVSFAGGEPFFDVMGCFCLREMGYIIFPQSVGLHNHLSLAGVPDNIAVKLGDFQNYFVERGIIKHGAFLSEFELYSIFGRFAETKKVEGCDSAAIESKRAGAGGWTQLERYLSSGHFNKGFLVRPQSNYNSKQKEMGIITWKPDGEKVVKVPERDWAIQKK